MTNQYSFQGFFIPVILFIASSQNPPNRNTNAPVDRLCTINHMRSEVGQIVPTDVIGIPSMIILSVAITNENDVLCAGGNTGSATATAIGGILPYTYHWSNGASGATINNLIAGVYTVTVTDLQNAMATVAATISQPLPLLVSTPVVMNVTSNGGNNGSITANATGGSSPYLYNWSNGGFGATISNLTAGTYTVTVTDANQCTESLARIITQPPPIVINLVNLKHESCAGENDGSIQISFSGPPPLTALWSNGAMGPINNNLAPGAYTVTVTAGASGTLTATYTVNPGINISLLQIHHVTCNGGTDGAISVNASGGMPPFTYLWSNGMNGATITGLNAGIYQVTVTDHNGNGVTCTGMPIQINQPPHLDVNINLTSPNLCYGASTADLVVHANGGVPGYTYVWSNGTAGINNNNLPAGSYTVTVTDANLCTAIAAHAVGQPPPLNATIIQTSQIFCFGDSTAELAVLANGGIPGYTYLWSNGMTGASITGLNAGIYHVTVTDQNGNGVTCTTTATYMVAQPPLLNCNVSTTNETSAGANNGTATANHIGGTPGYTYLWNTNATTPMITGLPPGMYTVTVTDANGCTRVDAGHVNPFGCTLSVEIGPDIIICENDTAFVTAFVTGAFGQVSYLWSNGSNVNSINNTFPASGYFMVTVTDAANCQATDGINITEIVLPPLNCIVTNESVPGANDGAIICADSTLTYLWSTGTTTSSLVHLSSGTYCVTVTSDAYGCTATQCFNIQSGNCQLDVTPSVTNVNCFGESTGSVSLTVTGASQPVLYVWSNGQTTSEITNLGAGTYKVTVTDASQCTATATYAISQSPEIVIVVDSIRPITEQEPGAIYISVSGGVPPYIYLNNGPFGEPIQDLLSLGIPGLYHVTVTDAVGCTLEDSIQLEEDVAVGNFPKFSTLKVYPVPARDQLFIDLENVIQEVIITGIDGRLYKRINNPASNKIDVEELESGLYILIISDGENWYTARIAKL